MIDFIRSATSLNEWRIREGRVLANCSFGEQRRFPLNNTPIESNLLTFDNTNITFLENAAILSRILGAALCIIDNYELLCELRNNCAQSTS